MNPERKLNIAVILNGISHHKKTFYQKYLPAIEEHFAVSVFETKTENDAIALSAKAVETCQYQVILAAGGDGTLHQVVNGVIRDRENESQLPVVGVIPLGSGNDFAKTAGASKNPEDMIQLLKKWEARKVNLGRIRYTDFTGEIRERYFINVADIGMGPEVVKRISNGGRKFGGAIAYYKGILDTFIRYKMMEVSATTDQWSWKGKLRSLAVANGKYYGHGLCIAPDAKPDDDVFHVFICGKVSVFDFIRYSETMKKGKHVRIPEICYRETKSISLASESDCLIEGDGEVLGRLPATVTLLDRTINFLM